MKKFLLVVFLIVLAIVVVFASFIALDAVIRTLFVPSDYLFYEHTPLASIAFPITASALAVYIAFLVIDKCLKIKVDEESEEVELMRYISSMSLRAKAIAILLWLAVMYVFSSSLTYVTEDKIVIVSPLNPKGERYSYHDVEKVETGFSDKTFALFDYEQEGSFYYKITLDGKERVFHMPSVNDDIERYDDTYLELEEFDRALVKCGVQKEASSKGYENCGFDKEYVDRFLRIIGGK